MRKRTQAREYALQILYQIDVRKDPEDKILVDFWKNIEAEPEVSDFAAKIVIGTIRNKKKIDEMITKYASNWKLSRMAVIDRNGLRWYLGS